MLSLHGMWLPAAGSLELLADTRSHRLCPSGAAVRQQENELVASESGRKILGSRRPPQDVASGHQDHIAASMAVGVVYDLELVEVDGQHGDRCVVSA